MSTAVPSGAIIVDFSVSEYCGDNNIRFYGLKS